MSPSIRLLLVRAGLRLEAFFSRVVEKIHPPPPPPPPPPNPAPRPLMAERLAILAERLVVLIQALPQELQDPIFAHVLSCSVESDGNGIVHITKDYKPPVGLQLNRELRRIFAQHYYGFYAFHVPFPTTITWNILDRSFEGGHIWGYHVFRCWYSALEPSHRDLIHTIRLRKRRRPRCRTVYDMQLEADRSMCYATCEQPYATPIRPGVLAVRLHPATGDWWYFPDPWHPRGQCQPSVNE